MNILHLLSQRPDSTGSGIYLQAMLRQAAGNGHRNRLVAAINHEEESRPLALPAAVSLVPFDTAELDFALPGMSDVMPYPSSRFSEMSRSRLDRYEEAFYQRIAPLIEEQRPDLIHSHHLWLLTSLVKRCWPDIPLAASCHGSDLRQFRLCPGLQSRVLQGCRQVETIFALTAAQRSEITSLYGLPEERIVVTGAGYDESRFVPAEKPTPPPLQIVSCGKLSRAKGVVWLLRALRKLDDIAFHLHLVGSGSGSEHLECLLEAERLGSRVTRHGVLPQDQLAGLFKRCHLFILPSLYEGLPLVVIEALACGCTAAATDLPGTRTIRDQTDARHLRLIPLPPLEGLDQPAAAAEGRFVADITRTVRNSCLDWLASPPPEPWTIAAGTAAFSWREVFSKVEKQYRRIGLVPGR